MDEADDEKCNPQVKARAENVCETFIMCLCAHTSQQRVEAHNFLGKKTQQRQVLGSSAKVGSWSLTL